MTQLLKNVMFCVFQKADFLSSRCFVCRFYLLGFILQSSFPVFYVGFFSLSL